MRPRPAPREADDVTLVKLALPLGRAERGRGRRSLGASGADLVALLFDRRRRPRVGDWS